MDNLLVALVTFAATFYLPGRLAYALLPGPRPRGETFAASLGLGLVIVGTVTTLLHGCLLHSFLGWDLRPWVVLAVSLICALTLAGLGYRRGSLRRGLAWERPNGEQLALAAFTAFSTLFFLLNFDVDQVVHTSCIVDAISQLAAPSTAASPEAPFFHGDFTHQRLGIGVLMMPLVGLFGDLGYRLSYALHGLLAPGLGFALGRHVFGRRVPAWLVATLFTFSGYALEIRIFDENMMASPFGVLALVLLLRPTIAPFAAGVAMSLFLGIRHLGVLIMPAALLLAWHRGSREPGPARTPLSTAALFLLGAVVFLSPVLVLQVQRVFLFGYWVPGGFPLTQHSFMGIEFAFPRPLNWPFLPEPVRSPLQPYPNMLHYPLDLVRRFGLPLLSLVPLGLCWLWRRARATAATLVVWFMVPLGVVLFLSCWFEPNKVGIPATGVAPLLVFMVAGGVALWEARWRAWRPLLAVALTGALLAGFVVSARQWKAPLDPRLQAIFKGSQHRDPVLHVYDETPYLDWLRGRFGLRVLPALREGFWHRGLLGLQLRQLGHALAAPQIRTHSRSLQDYFWGLCEWVATPETHSARYQRWLGGTYGTRLWAGDGVAAPRGLYTLDLTAPPSLSPRAIRAGGTGAEPLVLEDGEIVVVDGVAAPWSRFPLRLFLGRDHVGAIHIVVLPVAPGDVECRRPTDPPTRSLDMRAWPDGRIPMVLPEGAVVRLQDIRNVFFGIAFVRFAVLEPGSVWLSGTEQMTLSPHLPEEEERSASAGSRSETREESKEDSR